MKVEIRKEIIDKANKCPNDFCCLSDDGYACKAKYCIDGEALFVDEKSSNSCPYKLGSRSSSICKCPVRKEVFRLYNR